MIFYFSGTGNSLEAAQILASETGDRIVDIGTSYKYKRFNFFLTKGENLGFVFPTYGCSTPSIIDRFIAHAKFLDEEGDAFVPNYCFLVLTCACFVGNTDRFFAQRLLDCQSIVLDAAFSIKTVGNCVSLYNPASGKKRDTLLCHAREQAHDIAGKIADTSPVSMVTRNLLGRAQSFVGARHDKSYSTKEFYALPTCTRCGKCTEVCPTNTVTLYEGQPHWAELGCTQCFACIHQCPAHAIQHGKKTESRGRYINPILLTQEN